VNGREKYIASQAPRVRRTHPARSAQALNTSGAGIVHRQMMDLQRQPNLNKADTSRLKDLRRDWNRNRKYTDAGMKISGASSPLDAQKYFADTTRDFRDTNRDAYASMYPLTNMAMEYPQKGGILGMIAKEIFGKISDFGKSIINREGIAGAADSDEADMEDYAEKTFGFYPSDVHPGLPLKDDIFVAPPNDTDDIIWNERDTPINLEEVSLKDYKGGEGAAGQKIPNPPGYLLESPYPEFSELNVDLQLPYTPPFDEGREDFIRRQNEYVIPEPIFPGNVRQDDPYETSAYEKWYNERLNNLLADQYQEWGPHRNEPRTSYYGSHWYDEYERQKRNEMEIAKGIRSPMDR